MINKSGPILRPTDMHTEFNENRSSHRRFGGVLLQTPTREFYV